MSLVTPAMTLYSLLYQQATVSIFLNSDLESVFIIYIGYLQLLPVKKQLVTYPYQFVTATCTTLHK